MKFDLTKNFRRHLQDQRREVEREIERGEKFVHNNRSIVNAKTNSVIACTCNL